KTFVNAKAGSYVYHCRVHADMSGTVVVSGAPVPAFSATPDAPFAGDEIAFDASASTDLDGTIARYEWDLDGNGTSETDTGTPPSASRAYTAGATLTIALRVTDSAGDSTTATRPLTITNAPPVAALTSTGTATVTFDGSGSSDPDGTIAKFLWDLDGNG